MCYNFHKVEEQIIHTQERIDHWKMRNTFVFFCLTLILLILIFECPTILKAEDLSKNENVATLATKEEEGLTKESNRENDEQKVQNSQNDERVGKQFWPMLPR
jgi:hypothetical protein